MDENNANTIEPLSCTLTGAELQQRKATVLQSMRTKVLETKELENGFSFKFNGTDEVLDELITFIKSERQCCSFFTFNLSVANDKSFITMELTGPVGAKEFIKAEMGM